MALVVGVACTVGTLPRWRAALAASPRDQEPVEPQRVARASLLTISGTVLREDEKTPVAGVRLQLRNIDKGTIVGQTVSDQNGAFALDVLEPGLYVVEVVDDEGVKAVGQPVRVAHSTLTSNVILPATARRLSSLNPSRKPGLLILSTAGAAGISAWAIAGRPESPER